MEQGSVLRPMEYLRDRTLSVSIPLEQGSVLRPLDVARMVFFGEVSIPLEQGSVLRHNTIYADNKVTSQSLWNRAVSYDRIDDLTIIYLK